MRFDSSDISCGVKQMYNLGDITGIKDVRTRLSLTSFASLLPGSPFDYAPFPKDEPFPTARESEMAFDRRWDAWDEERRKWMVVHGDPDDFESDDEDEGIVKGYTYMFSDNDKNLNGSRIAEWIKKYKLGKLTEHGWVVNPNTKAKINVWIWTYNGAVIPSTAKDVKKVKKDVKQAKVTSFIPTRARNATVRRHARNG